MIPTPSHPRIGTPYGKHGSMWGGGIHKGVDFPCPTGTDVLAPWGGTVVEVGRTSWGSAFGTAVIIDFDHLPNGDPGLWGILAHFSSATVKPGQRVEAGTKVGRSGATGNVSGPHLHFEVQKGPHWNQNAHVNPQPWLDAARSTGAAPVPTNDDFISLKETGIHKVRTNTDIHIDIDGHTNWEAEEPSGRHLLALYANVDLPAPGTPQRDALWYGGIRTWYNQIPENDITGLNGPVPCARFGDQHQLIAHTWPHTVDRSNWEFCLRLYAFDANGNEMNFEVELETREVKIIGDKT